MKNEKAFNPRVPAWVQKKLMQIAELAENTSLFLDGFGFLELSEVTTSAIEWESRPGFWSWTMGGYRVDVLHYGALSTGSYITKGQKEEKERLQQMLKQEFLADYPDANSESYYNHPAFGQYEAGYYSDGSDIDIAQFRAWVDDKHQITLDLTIFYRDAPYHRAETGELIAQLELTEVQCARIKLETIEKFFRRAIKRA